MILSILHNIWILLTHSPRSSVITGPFGLVPPELLDLIISHLAHHRATLLSCALVHPTWSRISRHHLLPLTLTVSSPGTARGLAQLLCSPLETLSPSITNITLSSYLSPTKTCSYRKLLLVLQGKCAILRSGAVENDPSLVGILAQYLPDLTTFKVSGSYKDMTGFMHAVSDSYPRIVELDIRFLESRFNFPDASLPGLRAVRLVLPCLRTLRVVGWNNELVRWLGENVVGTLERLELVSSSRVSACCLEEANVLFQGNKETLKDVRLTFAMLGVAFDLSGLKCLRSLDIARRVLSRGTQVTMDGWRMPLSLERLRVRDIVRVRTGHCCVEDGEQIETDEGIVFEGESLQRVLGM